MMVQEDTPLMAKELYVKIMSKIFSYGLTMNHDQLIHTVLALDPDMKDHAEDGSMLACVLSLLLNTGPLPNITNYKYIHTLHNSVLEYLKSHPMSTEKLTASSILKMEAGLRFLLVRSLLYCRGKFRNTDIEAAVKLWFTDDIDQFKSIIKHQANEDLMREYLEANSRARSHFASRLEEPVSKDEEDPGEGALRLYEYVCEGGTTCSVKEALSILYDDLQAQGSTILDSLNPSSSCDSQDKLEPLEGGSLYLTSGISHQEKENLAPPRLSGGSSSVDSEKVVLEYVYQRLGNRTQTELINLATHIHDIKMQSDFFLNIENF